MRIAAVTFHAKNIFGPVGDSSLSTVLSSLEPHADKALVIDYGDGSQVRPGYHVTEVKAGSFVTLDCGGNPDAWQETILQVEDIALSEDKTQMSVGKFRRILAEVDRKVRLNNDARLTLEVSRPGEAMRVFDVASVGIDGDSAVIQLGERSAICKPRHRAGAARAAACCSPSSSSGPKGCC